MPLGDFTEAGSTPRPFPIGRSARLLFGLGAGFYFIWNLTQVSERVGSDIPASGYWVAVGIAWLGFSDLVVVGFSRRSGRWPQVAVFPFALALVVADLAAYESAWGPPLGLGVFSFTEFFFGFIGISFVLAAVFRVPG